MHATAGNDAPGDPSPTLEGLLVDDEESLEWAADDWGHLLHHRPRAVLRPATIADIVATTRYARARRLAFVPRGQGHSTGGQAQADGGIVVDLSGFDNVREVGDDHVVVEAGARWSQVLNATLPHGLTPPVLTDYLELSVGGTLSVGGIGGSSHRHGLQTDNVVELEVVTPKGELRTCSPTLHPRLFDDVRAGHGKHGVIVRATLRLIPAAAHVREHKLYYRDLSTFLVDQRRLVAEGRFDHLQGQAQLDDDGKWHYVLEAATFHNGETKNDVGPRIRDLAYQRGTEEVEELTYFDFLNQMAPQEELLRSIGAWHHPHPWLNLFLPDSAADEIVAATMGRLTADDIGETGVVLVYPFHTNKITTPRLKLPDEPRAFLFALLRTAPPDDSAAIQRMLDGNHAPRRMALAAGGTVYL